MFIICYKKIALSFFLGTPFKNHKNNKIGERSTTNEVTSENLIILTCFSLLSPHTTEATNQHRKAIIPTWKNNLDKLPSLHFSSCSIHFHDELFTLLYDRFVEKGKNR